MNHVSPTFVIAALLLGSALPDATAQFKWSNPLVDRGNLPDSVKHRTFRSPSMDVDVGYCIYFPQGYETSKKRFPVIYVLHGGKHTSDERKLLKIVPFIRNLRKSRGEPMPMIYVFVNGGAVSFYNYPAKNSFGEDVFVKELIPHIDRTYRTIADRGGRGIEGHSGGGRAAVRIGFRYPHLFGSAIATCGGYDFEKLIRETGADGNLKDYLPGDNTFDRAISYAKTRKPELPLLIVVGTRDLRYKYNIDYMNFLDGLEIPYESLIVPYVQHGPSPIYTAVGRELLRFHKRQLVQPR